ncbi:MAG TPA: hypothetical protein VGC46_11000 [Allosphingosinicella sp.]|jgi:hypothetical protein
MLEPKKPGDPVEGGDGLRSTTTTDQKTKDGGQKGSTDSTETKQQK